MLRAESRYDNGEGESETTEMFRPDPIVPDQSGLASTQSVPEVLDLLALLTDFHHRLDADLKVNL